MRLQLQQQREAAHPDFKLLRMAVVDLQSFAYIGRLFFGDPATGKHSWDCDCRPSDGLWLALRVRPARPPSMRSTCLPCTAGWLSTAGRLLLCSAAAAALLSTLHLGGSNLSAHCLCSLASPGLRASPRAGHPVGAVRSARLRGPWWVQSRCPMYVKKHVWDQNQQVLKALAPGAAVHSVEQPEELSGIAAATTLRQARLAGLSAHSCTQVGVALSGL